MSPFQNHSIETWSDVTESLIKKFPLSMDELVDVVSCSWHRVWESRIGDNTLSFHLLEIDPPATVIGYILEKLIAKELSMRHPTYWKGACADNDKDIVYINDTRFSFEIKTSGQRGVKVFGNRSYGQKLQNVDHAKKDKSGYYLTVNFHKDNLNLIRFGWIDADDWKSQTASTGQMASLGKEVYQYKLIELIYPYLLDANIFIVNGISKKVENELNEKNIYTLKDLMTSKSLSGKYLKHQTKAIESYGKLLNQ